MRHRFVYRRWIIRRAPSEVRPHQFGARARGVFHWRSPCYDVIVTDRLSGSMVGSLLGFIVLVAVFCVGGCEKNAAQTTAQSVAASVAKCSIRSTLPHELVATVTTGQCLCATNGTSCIPPVKCPENQTLELYESATNITVCLVDITPARKSASLPSTSKITPQYSVTNSTAATTPNVGAVKTSGLSDVTESSSSVHKLMTVLQTEGSVTTTPYSVIKDDRLNRTTKSRKTKRSQPAKITAQNERDLENKGKNQGKDIGSEAASTTPAGDILTTTSSEKTARTNQKGVTMHTEENMAELESSTARESVTIAGTTEAAPLGSIPSTQSVPLQQCFEIAVPEPPLEPKWSEREAVQNTVLVRWSWPHNHSNLRMALAWNDSKEVYTKASSYEIDLERPWTKRNVSLKQCIQRDNDPCTSFICGAERVISIYTVPQAPVQLEKVYQNSSTTSTAFLTWTRPKLLYPDLEYLVELSWVNGNGTTNGTSYEVGPFLPYSENSIALKLCISDDEWGSICGAEANISVRTLPGAPSAVRDLNIISVGSTYLELNWTAPSERNGPLDFYRISWSENGSAEAEGGENSTAHYNITGLEPWCNYSINVSACNLASQASEDKSDMCGQVATVAIQTDVDAPGPIRDLKILSVGSTYLELNWTAPSERNGPLDFYRISWSENGSAETEGGESSTAHYNITGLEPWCNYSINVSACNRASQASEDKSDMCGQVATVALQTDVDAPTAPRNLRVKNALSTAITVSWDRPDLANGPLDGYEVTLSIGSTTLNVSYVGDETYVTITDLKPYTTYTIEVRAFNVQDGKRLQGQPASVTKRTEIGIPSPPRNISCKATASSLNLSWKAPRDPNGQLAGYNVTWAEKGGEANYTETSATIITIDNLKAYTVYVVTISAFNTLPSGTALVSEEEVCEHKTWPAEPGAVQDLELHKVETDHVEINWTAPTETNGPLDFYWISWSKKDTAKIEGKGNSSVYYKVTGLQPWFNYTIHVSACNHPSVESGVKRDMCGEAVTVDVQTSVDAPGPVKELSTMSTGSTFVDVTWTEPAAKNGPISFYLVEWKSTITNGSQKVKAPSEEASVRYNISHLRPWTNHSISVRACNINLNKNELCGQYTLLTVSTAAGAPSAPTSVFVRPETRNLSLEWKAPEVPNGAINGYLVCLVSADVDHERREEEVSGTQTVLQELEPYCRYNVSVAAYNLFNETSRLVGDGYSLQVITYPEPPGPVEDIQVVAFRNNSVRLTWRIPSKPRGKLDSFLLRVSDSKDHTEVERRVYPLADVCNEKRCEHLSTRLHAECEYLFDIRGINEGVREPGEPPLKVLLVTVPPGDPPQAKNISTAEDDIPYQPYSQFLFAMTTDTFNNFNGAIVAYEVIASESSYIEQNVSGHTWGEVMSKDFVSPYLASPKGWNPFIADSSGGYDPMACSLFSGRVVCVLGAQHCLSNAPMPCNGPLKPGKRYALYIKGYTAGGSRATVPLHFYTEPLPARSDGGVIAGGVIGGLLLGLLLLAATVYSKKLRIVVGRQKSQTNGDVKGGPVTDSSIDLVPVSSYNGIPKKPEVITSENTGMCTEEDNSSPVIYEPRGPIRKTEFSAYMEEMMRDCGYKFTDEYDRLVEMSPHYRSDAARDPANSKKNRFTNIHPFDKNRVPLSEINGDPHSSYINASFIQGFNSMREYVAAQGPNVTTVNDFWRMIWEHDVPCVVMLTQCIEGNKKKCERYWPEEEQSYGEVQVKKNSVTTHEDYIVTQFSIKSDDSSHWRNLNHLFFTGWPDHGVPGTPRKLIDFVRACQKFFGPRTGNQPPIVVHCSAGVGRTGTFIALDYLLQLLPVQDTVNIFGLVLQLREGRRCMVQTENQYIYLHKCIKAVLDEEDKQTADLPEEPIYENLGSLRGTGESQL